MDTGTISTAVINQDGIYTIPNLPIGAYTLQTSFPGFRTYVQTGILLRVNDHVQIKVVMKVGALAETVEVNANAGLLETQQNTISQSSISNYRRPAAQPPGSDVAHYDLRRVNQSQRRNQHGPQECFQFTIHFHRG